MLTTFRQRERREGIVLKTISFPVPPPSMDDLYQRFEQRGDAEDEADPGVPHHQSHRTDFPARAHLRHGARARNPSDRRRAHAFNHFPFKISDLNCDYYGSSLHKWTCAPIGTGFLYVRKSRIARAPGL